ncbi:MAG: PucR family transcriptional regulator ligand-binding domain-containing protein [Sporolactobacillus sp.]
MAADFSFCVKDVLERPIFKRAQLIAGAKGQYREVRWVHILEITHAAPYVSENDLILTTGLWLKQSLRSELDFMRQIIEHRTAGLCIEFGTTVDEIPEEMIALCEAHDFPLILFRQPIRFEEITQDIHSFIINRHFELLQRLEQYSRKQQQLIVQSSDIAALLRLFHDYTNHAVFYLSPVALPAYYPAASGKEAASINDWFRAQLKKSGGPIESVCLLPLGPARHLLLQPVTCFGQVFSYVAVVADQPQPGEYLTLVLDYTAKAIATVLLRTQFLEERIMRSHNQLIQDILNRRIDTEEQAELQMGLPVPGSASYLFIGGVIACEHDVLASGAERMETLNQDLAVLIRALLKTTRVHHLMMQQNNRMYVLCAVESREGDGNLLQQMQHLLDALDKFARKQLDGLTFRAGFGNPTLRLLEAYRCFQEGEQVIVVQSRINSMRTCHFYKDLGIYQLLMNVSHDFLEYFVHEQIGDLLTSERGRELKLEETLTIFFRTGLSKGETAKQLFIHRQTLYNRLDKIRDILGDDFASPNRRYSLEMALLARQLIEGQR